ncbi:MAG: hypothetical protein C4311_05495 [Chloroflexota bacterium]
MGKPWEAIPALRTISHLMLIGFTALSWLYALGLVAYLPLREVLWRRGWGVLAINFIPWLFVPLLALIPLALLLRAWPLRGATLLATLVFLVLYGDRFLPRLPVAQANRPGFRVMTWNIHLHNLNIEEAAATIARESPDIVALQELGAEMAEGLVTRLGERYPYRVLHLEAGYWSSGVLSRHPILEDKGFLMSAGQRIVHHIVLEVAGQPIHLFNVHLHLRGVGGGNGDEFLTSTFPGLRAAFLQDEEVDRLIAEVQAQHGPVLVVGDFNLTDQTPNYARINAVLRDAFRQAGWGFGFTYPNKKHVRGIYTPFPLVRLDYVFHSPDLQAIRAWVGKEGGSDHRYVVAELSRQD